ncbi:MAG: DUF2851 family protein [Dysgonamonadaceae bacterium]|jgi:hypothetical protein|nr:DUF2851 family protein [Dysgonamonadaceae bacterium]
MESLLHYVWKHRLYDENSLLTGDGQRFEIIDTGIYNIHAGPDFFNAKIKIGDKLWAGNVEIHNLSSDWYRHRHDSDKAYNSVIFHVAESLDTSEIRDESGRVIPQWEMKFPQIIRDNYQFLLESDSQIPCIGRIREISEIYLSDWKAALLTERLERKANDIFSLLKTYKNDWNEVFYIILSRNFGFNVNNDAFERLAKSLPLKIILKNSQFSIQSEALFLGQAGLLDEEENGDNYYNSLRKGYIFLQKKYKLTPLEKHTFKNLRIRPNNFSLIKIVQLAGIICNRQGLFSELIGISEEQDMRNFFASDINEYWKTHYQFGKISSCREKKLGFSAISLLMINVVSAMFFAYGKRKNKPEYTEKALQLLETIRAEQNYIVKQFVRAGILMNNAGDSQAIIQLKREYCEKKKCIYCRIGHQLLAKDSSDTTVPREQYH